MFYYTVNWNLDGWAEILFTSMIFAYHFLVIKNFKAIKAKKAGIRPNYTLNFWILKDYKID